MIWFLRLAALVVLVSMLTVTSWASHCVALWNMPRELATHPWFIATLCDTYFAFLAFWAWVAYKETSALARVLWLLAIVLLGNIAMSIYVLREVFRLPTDATFEERPAAPPMTVAVVSTDRPPKRSFWQRRVLAPIGAQLTQGITPRKIALTIALGALLGIFPILGATTILCALAAVALRLNQPVIQAVNFLVYPLHLLLLIPFYRAGEHLLGRPAMPLNIKLILERFHANAGQFLRDFGMIGVGGIFAWAIVAPFAGALIFAVVHPILRRAAARLHKPDTATAS